MTKKSTFDQKKDAIFKALAAVLGQHGFQVRKEELKQGPGWRANSGTCRAVSERLIFVDRRLPQDEQINFLIQATLELRITLTSEQLATLPESMQQVLNDMQSAAAA